MLDRKLLARESARKALALRKRLSISLEDAVAPIDAADLLEIDVRLVDIPSMEGIYVTGTAPKIILSCLRPSGRRNFTCAHELGHHEFGHGQQFDELVDHRSSRRRVDPKEFSADCFASYFLMPKATVDSGMFRRGFQYNSITPLQAYSMSTWLGVGYETFINHLAYGLKAISRSQAAILLKSTPKSIRSVLASDRIDQPMIMVDKAWSGRPVDCEVGDYLHLPRGTLIEGNNLVLIKQTASADLAQASQPGLGRLSQGWPMWSTYVRASRRQYVGRSRYRFEEEVDE